jgi:hypothetical protein
VVKTIESAGGTIDSCRRLSECFDLHFPLNLAKVLKYAVLVSGNKAHPKRSARSAVQR